MFLFDLFLCAKKLLVVELNCSNILDVEEIGWDFGEPDEEASHTKGLLDVTSCLKHISSLKNLKLNMEIFKPSSARSVCSDVALCRNLEQLYLVKCGPFATQELLSPLMETPSLTKYLHGLPIHASS